MAKDRKKLRVVLDTVMNTCEALVKPVKVTFILVINQLNSQILVL